MSNLKSSCEKNHLSIVSVRQQTSTSGKTVWRRNGIQITTLSKTFAWSSGYQENDFKSANNKRSKLKSTNKSK